MNAYIIAALRSPVGKAPKGSFRFLRPDDLAAQVIRQLLAQVPQLEKERIDDLIVGNAMPDAVFATGHALAAYARSLAISVTDGQM